MRKKPEICGAALFLMATGLIFILHGELPPIHWALRGKRLGYHMSQSVVTSVPDDEVRIDMQLQDTQITVVVCSPYNDPLMLDGLRVRLRGLEDTNTEGIDRIRMVEYHADENRAVVVFDRILPGRYLATVYDRVQVAGISRKR